MKNKYDTIPLGARFGRFIVLKFVGSDPLKHPESKKNRYKCKCDCGVIKIIGKTLLTRGIIRSCGCLRVDDIRSRAFIHGETQKTKEYRAWKSMKRRCSNPIKKDGPNYVKYGVKVCKRWINSYPNFLKDMGRAPSPKHSIDRFPNNKGHYKPSNCRWATNKQQAQNHCK